MLNNATGVIVDWFKEFTFLSRLEFLRIKDALFMLLLERVEFLPETRDFIIRKLQFAAALDQLKSKCKCGCAKEAGKCPYMLNFHSGVPNV